MKKLYKVFDPSFNQEYVTPWLTEIEDSIKDFVGRKYILGLAKFIRKLEIGQTLETYGYNVTRIQ